MWQNILVWVMAYFGIFLSHIKWFSLGSSNVRLNHLMWERKITKYAIIQTKIFCHIIEEKRVLVLQEVKVINPGRRVNGIFGSPVNIDYQEIARCAKCTEIHKCSK